jgi:allantoicase
MDEDIVMVKDESPTYHERATYRRDSHTACGRYALNTAWVTGWETMKRTEALELDKSRCKACTRVVGSGH